MQTGHGITAKKLEELCAAGQFQPLGHRVLLEAVLEQEAILTTLELGELDHRTAVAWVVRAIGPSIHSDLMAGDLVVNLSISGERIGGKASRWMVVHEDDLAVRVRGLSLE